MLPPVQPNSSEWCIAVFGNGKAWCSPIVKSSVAFVSPVNWPWACASHHWTAAGLRVGSVPPWGACPVVTRGPGPPSGPGPHSPHRAKVHGNPKPRKHHMGKHQEEAGGWLPTASFGLSKHGIGWAKRSCRACRHLSLAARSSQQRRKL
eukprot:15474256-Alexandrium_andersonii.AAC.3